MKPHFLAALLLAIPAAASGDDVFLSALKAELKRSYEGLKAQEGAPLYYLGYGGRDTWTYDASAENGAINSAADRHYRTVDADVRVGDASLDNTHQFKGSQGSMENDSGSSVQVTVDDDADSLRASLWHLTDAAYKAAQNRYTKVQTNRAVTAAEEDPSDDFSPAPARKARSLAAMPAFDRDAWNARLRRLSAEFKSTPEIVDSYVGLSVRAENRLMVNSEGSEIVEGGVFVRLSYNIQARTEDGMSLSRFNSYDADNLEDLPGDEALLKDMRRSVSELLALHRAPLVEPYTGPAIFRNRAAGVFFHEILGHRLEGHRQKLEEEGQTFTKMLGKEVTAPFISVYDDPSLQRFKGTFLRGAYKFDDEAVAAERVSLVENGVLKGFLLSRSPIRGFPKSNGHGRRSSGRDVVARMGNLMIEASESVPYARLREMLIEEAKRQGKPYGLVFEDISGGFTTTGRAGAQSFKVIPLLVYRVYTDGRPDEAVRGVDVVGTPQASFMKIAAAGDDPDIFNGTCGAESGWVPVSAVSPSLLVSEIEVEKKAKDSEKPPLLPPPFHDPEAPR